MRKYRHCYLTYREMIFAKSLVPTLFNFTRSAKIAGYSKTSVKKQGYRLKQSVAVRIYFSWLQDQGMFLERFPHAEILLPDYDELKARLAKCGIKVHNSDLKRADSQSIGFDAEFVPKKLRKLYKEIIPKGYHVKHRDEL